MKCTSKQRGSALVEILIYVAIAAAIGGAIYAVYSYIDHRWETTAGIERGTKDKQAEWDAANERQRKLEAEKSAKAVTSLEKGNTSAKVIYRTITQSVDKYIDRPVYRNVCFDDDGLRDINAALSGSLAAPGKPNGTLPKPNAPK